MTQETTRPPTRPTLRPFKLWLCAFYAAWLGIVAVGDLWATVRDHWPIAVAMAFGSYVAGSTPMGGGTVGFPVLVLLFELPSSLGRNFGLAVQSIGMTSATIYLLSKRQPLDWKLLRPCLLGSLIGTPLGAVFVAPIVPDLWVKLLFAVVWASFGIMHLVKLREIVSATGESTRFAPWDRPIGLTVGVLGGIVASLTGVGIDMMLYVTLVLLFQADLKIAIPTSVVVMAFTSIVGIATNLLLAGFWPDHYRVEPEVFANWLAAAPVVAVGAPLGALVVSMISRTPTLVFVSLLCLAQFVWTLIDQRVTGWPLVGAIVGVLAMNAVFHELYKWGRSPNPLTAPHGEPTAAGPAS